MRGQGSADESSAQHAHANGDGLFAEPLEEIGRVIAHLRRAFAGGLDRADCEDAAYEAYRQLLTKQASAQTIEDPEGLLHAIAWRRARDEMRRRSVQASGGDAAAAVVPDQRPDPHERMAMRIDIARFAAAMHQMPAEQREAFQAATLARNTRRGELKPWKQLGLSRSTYFHRAERAAQAAAAAIEGRSREFKSWLIEAITANLLGTAKAEDVAHVERLIATDPKVAALAREIARAHDAAAAALPPLVVVAGADASLGDRLEAVFGRARDTLGSVLSRGEGADLATSPATAAGGRGAAGAGAGALAKIGLVGGAGKAALACVGGGALIGACVVAGVLPIPGASDRDADAESRHRVRSAGSADSSRATANDPTPDRAPLASQTADEAREREQRRGGHDRARGDGGEPSSATVSDPVAPSVPAVEQEFGVAAAATPAAGPAPADTDDADGASARTVRQEFAP